ncbi:hypothetical protein M422DRAFT_784882 [Sphaerobolus stellatus SS14]|uniref:F-box domain-containing protein n=1 Tax=Sphaerobolus stellatus (strain SS14) TaxID=990650 RepID=A0A0C9U0K2_SPHS4|nr:hypothetical protein M422DRAFT_784882 [Sphaerobolus stellatus SS14]
MLTIFLKKLESLKRRGHGTVQKKYLSLFSGVASNRPFRINDLPVEIIGDILAFSAQLFTWEEFTNYESTQGWDSWTRPGIAVNGLRSVCNLWKEVIDTTSAFRGIIIINKSFSEDKVKKNIENSKNSPLHVYVYSGTWRKVFILEFVIPLLLPHLHRIRAFWEIQWGDKQSLEEDRLECTLFEYLLRQSPDVLPKLHELVLLSCHLQNTEVDAPNLSTFISNPPPSKLVFSQRTLASLHRLSLPIDILQNTTVDYISQCQSLWVLEILPPNNPFILHNLFTADIPLPSLEMITFSPLDMSIVCLSKFMARIIAPKLSYISFDGRNKTQDFESFHCSHQLISKYNNIVKIRLRYIKDLDARYAMYALRPFHNLETLEIHACSVNKSFFLALSATPTDSICPQLKRIVIRNSLELALPSFIGFLGARCQFHPVTGVPLMEVSVTEDRRMFREKSDVLALKRLDRESGFRVRLHLYP